MLNRNNAVVFDSAFSIQNFSSRGRKFAGGEFEEEEGG